MFEQMRERFRFCSARRQAGGNPAQAKRARKE